MLLKFWTLWKSFGTDGISEMVDHNYKLASFARDYIKGIQTTLFIVLKKVFQYVLIIKILIQNYCVLNYIITIS